MGRTTHDERAALIGLRLRAARKRLGMSAAKVAIQAKLSESTLKNLEAGRHLPSTATLSQLCDNVPELGLTVSELLALQPLGDPAEEEALPPLNCWFSPSLNPMGLVGELQSTLRGKGGSIEQSFLYLDHMSAAAWLSIVRQRGYVYARESLPVQAAARAILGLTGAAPIDVIALGCGDGRQEVRLTKLLTGIAEQEVRLHLLDISQPLLAEAYRHAAGELERGVVLAQQGNFHDLPRYDHLLPPAGGDRRRRVVTMFGCTLGNLLNERDWVQRTLSGYAPGDLLLLHVSRTRAPAHDEAAVRRADLRLSGSLPGADREWLLGPIERYSRPAGAPLPAVQLVTELDLGTCVVPGSYAVREVALLGDRRFVLVTVKRYEPVQLGEALRPIGWEPVQLWEEEHDALLLMRRAGH